MPKSSALIFSIASALGQMPPAWIQLLPDAVAKPGDGREPWLVDPEAIVLASKASLPGLIDVDHILDLQPRGTRVPAMGWIEELASKGPNGEPGVWGRVDWTEDGQKALASKSYRFISPVFFHDKTTREIRHLVRASLVNDPALQLKALASCERDDTQTENSMSLAKIAGALKLTASAGTAVTEDQIVAAIASREAERETLSATIKRLAVAGGLAESTTIGENEVVALATKLKAPTASADLVPKSEVDKLQLQIASLQKEVTGDKSKAKVDAAIAGGKLIPAQREWALDYASRQPVEFDAFIAAQPVMLTNGAIVPTPTADGELTADQKAICAGMGLSEDAYKKELGIKKGAA